MRLMKKTEYLQEFYMGIKVAETLAIDYDENQLLVKEFSDRENHKRKEIMPDVK